MRRLSELGFGMTIPRLLYWSAALVLAICVGLSSAVIVNQVRNPLSAYALGFPPTGEASANAAVMSYAMRQARAPNSRINAFESRLARQGFRTEPLSVAALGAMALSLEREADAPRRRQIFELAAKLTRRNGLVSNELIKYAAARDDHRTFFLWLSRSVLTNYELRRAYITAMAEATAKEGAVEALVPVVGAAPSWSESYWQAVTSQQNSLPNAAKLRAAIARAPWRETRIMPTDQALSLGLVRIGRFDSLQELAAGLGQWKPSRAAAGNLLVNGDFGRQPLLPPLDWELAATGNLGASIDAAEKNLTVSAVAGARGFAARQVVSLAPGSYRLAWSLSSDAPMEPGTLTLQLRCAEAGVQAVNPPPVILTGGNRQAAVTIADGACRWHWLSVLVAVPDGGGGIDAYIRNLSLARVDRG